MAKLDSDTAIFEAARYADYCIDHETLQLLRPDEILTVKMTAAGALQIVNAVANAYGDPLLSIED